MNGDIISFNKEGVALKTIKAPRKNNTGITFEGEYLWVLTDAWDTIVYPHHNLPKTQVYKLDPDDGTPLDSMMVPYLNVPEVSKRFMLGLEYFNSSLLVSFNGGWGPCMYRLNENFSKLCCAHPGGMEVADNELWEIRFTGNPEMIVINEDSIIPNVIYGDSGIEWFNGGMIMPVSLDDSTSMEDWSRAMQFDFYATDLAWDGTSFWLLDPVAKKLKMMVIDTITADTTNPEQPIDTIPGDSIPWPWFIDQIEILPQQPTARDDISVVVHTTFPSGGCELLEKKITMEGSVIQISAVHNLGLLDYICSSVDTFELGTLPSGYYEVTYTVSTAGFIPASETFPLYVQDTIPLPYYLEIIPEKPVAGQEVKVVVHGICYVNSIIDVAGRHITLEASFNGCSMTPCGIDTLSIGFLTEDSYTIDYYLYDICLSQQEMDSLVFYENMALDIRGAASGTKLSPAEGMVAYPNPASDFVMLEIPRQDRELTLSLLSVDGQLLYKDRFRLTGSLHRIDLANIPSGYYILKLAGNDTVWTQKISVLK